MTKAKKLVLLTVAAFALTAIAGSASASAAVMCKTAPASHVCPAGDKYGVGTEIQTQLKPGTVLKFKSGIQVFECSSSTINYAITNAGGESAPVVTNMTEFNFGNCQGGAQFIVTKKGTQWTNWLSGTNNGAMTWGSNVEFTVKYGGMECTYNQTAAGKYLTVQGGASANVIASESTTDLVKSRGSTALCASNAKLIAEYSVSSPNPLYVTSS